MMGTIRCLTIAKASSSCSFVVSFWCLFENNNCSGSLRLSLYEKEELGGRTDACINKLRAGGMGAGWLLKNSHGGGEGRERERERRVLCSSSSCCCLLACCSSCRTGIRFQGRGHANPNSSLTLSSLSLLSLTRLPLYSTRLGD